MLEVACSESKCSESKAFSPLHSPGKSKTRKRVAILTNVILTRMCIEKYVSKTSQKFMVKASFWSA